MAGINYPRVILGGLAAGVVANVCDVVTNMYFVADDMQRMIQRLNLNASLLNSTSVMATWIVVDFIYATLIVWNYAAIRPRLGPGPATAVVAGLVIYGAVTAVLYGFMAMEIFTPALYWKSAVLSLVTTILTSLAGGAVYQERA